MATTLQIQLIENLYKVPLSVPDGNSLQERVNKFLATLSSNSVVSVTFIVDYLASTNQAAPLLSVRFLIRSRR